MANEIYDNVNKAARSTYDSMKALYDIQNNIAEQVFEQQLAVINLGVDYTSRQLKLASEARGYKELLNGQTEIVSDFGTKVQGITRNTIDILNESRDELSAWYEKGVKEAESGLKEAAKVVPMPTKAA
ncbi:MAG TPA: phasin family protein [Gammaproteobacteria bacterium]|nr:phasin family protein [Gammaproteobacteria bacterium]